ncbi:MAG: hypothetical protein RID81_07085 [Sandaracinaceae bacterium]
MCAQLAPTWDLDLARADRADLAAHADPGCFMCGGTGLDVVSTTDPALEMGICYANARALLDVLGIGWAECGEVSMAGARRALMYARATFARRAPAIVAARTLGPFEAILGQGPARLDCTGDLPRISTGPTVLAGAFDASDLEARLDRFEALVLAAIDAGADRLTWG